MSMCDQIEQGVDVFLGAALLAYIGKLRLFSWPLLYFEQRHPVHKGCFCDRTPCPFDRGRVEC